jgi:hypothetical protein
MNVDLKTILDKTAFSKNMRGPPWQTQMLAAMKQAVEQEREACAKAVEAAESSDTDWDTSYWNQAVARCAHLVRARSTS